GATVPTGEACLHCACVHGALSCRRHACAALPDPPPHRCHVLHRRGSCCPELHCPGNYIVRASTARCHAAVTRVPRCATHHRIGATCCIAGAPAALSCTAQVTTLCVRPRRAVMPPSRVGSCCPELHCPGNYIVRASTARCHAAVTRVPRCATHHRIGATCCIAGAPAALSCTAQLTTHGVTCVEGGTVYAAGSAMRSNVACELCFCLGGARRCVRPTCLPPPPGCKPRAAPGACCPQRYYCDHRTTKPPEEKHPHDCKVDGKWISEGEKIVSHKTSSNCTQCFCLRGAVQCQPLSCAPPLLGCKPLLRPGECCAHQYHCERAHQGPSIANFLALTSNALTSARNDHQASQNPLLSKKETITKTTLASIYLVKNTRITSATKNLVSTTKVKRKTSDPPPPESSSPASQNTTVNDTSQTTEELTTVAKVITTTESTTTTELTTETISTEQPEGSVRVMINGTINCTTELSSTSLPLNFTFNDTDKIEKITMESHPRIPLIDVSNLEDHTFSPNDIITDRNVNGGFDENESFVINVTSSLSTNTSLTTTTKPPSKPTPTATKVFIATDIVESLNSSKKTKGDYDYDYTEPTLPPSLPNLKIIPFVAADAVVENERPKETLEYPIHETEDKYPVYYPSIDTKESTFVTRREDVYRSTQYPIFITDKGDQDLYPSLTQDVDLTSTGYSNYHNDLKASENEYTVSTSLGSRISDTQKAVTQQPLPSTTFKLKTPTVNLFSPPVETEGGFLPKGPSGLIDEYYAVFPTTPAGPHLTTSMQLDINRGECVSSDGRHVPEGNTITLACSDCTCAWAELHCSPRACHTPPGCRRRPASSNSVDLCCGELICDEGNILHELRQGRGTRKNCRKDFADPFYYTTEITIDEAVHKIQDVFNDPINLNKNVSKTTIPHRDIVATAESFTVASTPVTVENVTMKQTLITTTPVPVSKEPEQDQPLEYEEEEEDGGFSFGNVLKLLLSGDSYETTTTPPTRLPTTSKLPLVKVTTTTRRPRPTPKLQPPAPKLTIAPFVPMPLHPYIPPKIPQNPINRIDHLVLGEATAIKRTTLRPVATPPRATSTSRPTTQRIVTTPTEMTKNEEYTTTESLRPPGGLPGIGPGLLKLAGCNIYGKMYRVGRIIAELSTPCQECWCTEYGVQCKQLKC
ncbi:Uncharacterized protein OBRU01_14315, partial [Operophtera brumata]